MCSMDAQSEVWADMGEKKWAAPPRNPQTNPQSPPYWTLDTTTDEWVQHQRDGTEICREPTRRKHQDA
jgi:hypothetical protein